jgi:hypothetical protein
MEFAAAKEIAAALVEGAPPTHSARIVSAPCPAGVRVIFFNAADQPICVADLT